MNYRTKAIIGVSILVALFLVFVLGSIFLPFEPCATSLPQKNMPPSLEHWFGTDELGRDLFARTLQGMRISITIGALAAIIDLGIGTLWGSVAAFSSRRVDRCMMRIAELIYSMPYLLFVILASVFLGTGLISIVVAMVCIGWIQMARVVRLLVKEAQCADYVQAAVALGVPPGRLFFSHIVPNIIGPVIAVCMLSVPHAIFVEAFLSFLGIGIQPPIASLGSMVGDAIPAMRYFPWRLLFPASVISLLIFSIMLLSDSLRDLYDPKQRIRKKHVFVQAE